MWGKKNTTSSKTKVQLKFVNIMQDFISQDFIMQVVFDGNKTISKFVQNNLSQLHTDDQH